MSTYTLNQAVADLVEIDRIEQNFRFHLLAALSEAREASIKMDANLRDKLMDSLTKCFSPEGDYQSDALKDAFTDAKALAEDVIEAEQDEVNHARKIGNGL